MTNIREDVLTGNKTLDQIPQSKHNAIRLECLNTLQFAQRSTDKLIVPTSKESLNEHAEMINYLCANRKDEKGKEIKPFSLAPTWLTIERCELAISILCNEFGYSQRLRVLHGEVEYSTNKRLGDLQDNFFDVMLTKYNHAPLKDGESRELSGRTQYWSFSESHYGLRIESDQYPNTFGFIWQYPTMSGLWLLGCAVSPFRIKSPHFRTTLPKDRPYHHTYDGLRYYNNLTGK